MHRSDVARKPRRPAAARNSSPATRAPIPAMDTFGPYRSTRRASDARELRRDARLTNAASPLSTTGHAGPRRPCRRTSHRTACRRATRDRSWRCAGRVAASDRRASDAPHLRGCGCMSCRRSTNSSRSPSTGARRIPNRRRSRVYLRKAQARRNRRLADQRRCSAAHTDKTATSVNVAAADSEVLARQLQRRRPSPLRRACAR